MLLNVGRARKASSRSSGAHHRAALLQKTGAVFPVRSQPWDTCEARCGPCVGSARQASFSRRVHFQWSRVNDAQRVSGRRHLGQRLASYERNVTSHARLASGGLCGSGLRPGCCASAAASARPVDTVQAAAAQSLVQDRVRRVGTAQVAALIYVAQAPALLAVSVAAALQARRIRSRATRQGATKTRTTATLLHAHCLRHLGLFPSAPAAPAASLLSLGRALHACLISLCGWSSCSMRSPRAIAASTRTNRVICATKAWLVIL